MDDSHLVHTCMSACTRELNLILKEIRVITDKMRKDDEEEEVCLIYFRNYLSIQHNIFGTEISCNFGHFLQIIYIVAIIKKC